MWLRDLLLLFGEFLDGRFVGVAFLLFLQVLCRDELGPQLVQRHQHGVLLVPTGIEGGFRVVVELCG